MTPVSLTVLSWYSSDTVDFVCTNCDVPFDLGPQDTMALLFNFATDNVGWLHVAFTYTYHLVSGDTNVSKVIYTHTILLNIFANFKRPTISDSVFRPAVACEYDTNSILIKNPHCRPGTIVAITSSDSAHLLPLPKGLPVTVPPNGTMLLPVKVTRMTYGRGDVILTIYYAPEQ